MLRPADSYLGLEERWSTSQGADSTVFCFSAHLALTAACGKSVIWVHTA